MQRQWLTWNQNFIIDYRIRIGSFLSLCYFYSHPFIKNRSHLISTSHLFYKLSIIWMWIYGSRFRFFLRICKTFFVWRHLSHLGGLDVMYCPFRGRQNEMDGMKTMYFAVFTLWNTHSTLPLTTLNFVSLICISWLFVVSLHFQIVLNIIQFTTLHCPYSPTCNYCTLEIAK